MTTPTDPTEPTTLEPRRLVWLPLLLLGLAWGVLVPVMSAQAALATATFFGEASSAADRVDQHVLVGHTLALSSALVVVGFALSVWGRSNAGGWVFALLGLPTLGLGLAWLGTL
jgi:hypothetical protein